MPAQSSETMAHKKPADLGAGLSLTTNNVGPHPAGPVQYGQVSQAERAFAVASTFLSGILAISASQFIGAPLKMVDPKFYEEYMAFTKQSFAVLVTSITQWWAPTVVRVSGDESVKGQIAQLEDGTLKCSFPERIVLMANHQLYTDWLYLWWIAYTNEMHGHIYIILKESLRNLPILGRVGQLFNFIFLSRRWEKDSDSSYFKERIRKLNKPLMPMWLLIFPEGTNLSANTRETSKKWAAKNGLADLKHQVLPRSTGIRLCLQELRNTTEWLYDCTIAYEGTPTGQYAQDIFTLRSTFFEGRPPKSVNMHWRRFKISSIPLNNPKAFDVWLRNRWTEKDHYLEHFARTGNFPADKPWEIQPKESYSRRQGAIRPAKRIETEVKPANLREFMAIFAPVTAFITALLLFYGASETVLMSSDVKTALMSQTDAIRDLITQKAPTKSGLPDESLLPAVEALQKGLMSASKNGGQLPISDDVSKKQIMDLAYRLVEHPDLSPGKPTNAVATAATTGVSPLNGRLSGPGAKIKSQPPNSFTAGLKSTPETKTPRVTGSVKSITAGSSPAHKPVVKRPRANSSLAKPVPVQKPNAGTSNYNGGSIRPNKVVPTQPDKISTRPSANSTKVQNLSKNAPNSGTGQKSVPGLQASVKNAPKKVQAAGSVKNSEASGPRKLNASNVKKTDAR